MAACACQTNPDHTPKPKAYHRIEFPDKAYHSLQLAVPFEFNYPVYGQMERDSSEEALNHWYDLVFKPFNAKVHLSYYRVQNEDQLNALTEDARTFAFNHTVKATAIRQVPISFPERAVYGLIYEIEGNTASYLQFYLTDSTKHYLRGALYFNERPKVDSIQPVLSFLRSDIDHLIKTFNWR